MDPKQIDPLFKQYTRSRSPGCALAVMKDGRIIYKKGYGLANVEHNIPITPASVFNIGSEAKQFTAMAILLLVQEGKLTLDDDIREHLPQSPNFGHTITIRHLIHHTSGLRDSFPPLLLLSGFRESDVTTNDDVLRLFMAQRELNFAPGEEHAYANMGYIVLAKIVEKAAGKSFPAFCKARIFEPLGMANTRVPGNLFEVIPNRAQSYWENGGKFFNAYLADGVLGSTNVYTTVEDLARWDENFYTGQVGGMSLIEQMQQPGILNDGTQLDYAFGLVLGPGHAHNGWALVEHGGGHGGYTANLVRFPEAHLSVVILCNLFNWGMQSTALKVADTVLRELKRPVSTVQDVSASIETIDLPRNQLESKVGKYFNARRVLLREITFQGGKLQYMGMAIVPTGEHQFILESHPGVRVEFSAGEDGVPERVRLVSPSSDITYDRVEATAPSAEILKTYTGSYYSSELDVTWTLVLEGDALVVRQRKINPGPLTPVFVDGFQFAWPAPDFPVSFFVLFERDATGAIESFGVSDGRMRHLRFVKV